MISVIIPTYNREKTIVRSIESVLNQTYDDLEVIVVDDGSVDKTRQLVDDIKDTRVNYFHSFRNRGQSNARNVGIRKSNGDYIAFQDSDDVWLPEKLERQMKCFDNSDCGLVYSMFEYQNYNGNEKLSYPSREIPIEIKTGWIMKNMFAGNLIGMPTVLVKRDVIKTIGFFDEELECLEDFEWLLRVVKEFKVNMVEDVLVHTYFTTDSVSSNKLLEAKILCRLIITYKNEIKKYNSLEDMIWRIRFLGQQMNAEKLVEEMLIKTINYYND